MPNLSKDYVPECRGGTVDNVTGSGVAGWDEVTRTNEPLIQCRLLRGPRVCYASDDKTSELSRQADLSLETLDLRPLLLSPKPVPLKKAGPAKSVSRMQSEPKWWG